MSSRRIAASMEKRMAAGERSQEEIWRRYDSEFRRHSFQRGSRVLLTYAAVYDKYLRYLDRGDVQRQAAEACAADLRPRSRPAFCADDDHHAHPGLRRADARRRLVG